MDWSANERAVNATDVGADTRVKCKAVAVWGTRVGGISYLRT